MTDIYTLAEGSLVAIPGVHTGCDEKGRPYKYTYTKSDNTIRALEGEPVEIEAYQYVLYQLDIDGGSSYNLKDFMNSLHIYGEKRPCAWNLLACWQAKTGETLDTSKTWTIDCANAMGSRGRNTLPPENLPA